VALGDAKFMPQGPDASRDLLFGLPGLQMVWSIGTNS
jgi:hypothetical protein